MHNVYVTILVVLSNIFSEIWQVINKWGDHFKFKMATRYHVDSNWEQASCEPTYRIVYSCQFVCFLRHCILNYASLVIFTVAIFLNSRWRPDTMSVVIGSKLHVNLHIV